LIFFRIFQIVNDIAKIFNGFWISFHIRKSDSRFFDEWVFLVSEHTHTHTQHKVKYRYIPCN
jgi:hypothetical protein